MTNLEWIRTLSAKELSDLLYDYWLPRGQYVWTDSRKGLVKMLGENYLERDCDKCKHQGKCYCVKGLGCPFESKRGGGVMKAWYSKVRDTELKDGSVRATYVVTFETDNAELKREVEKYLQGIMDKDEPNSSEKPNNCDTCRNKGFEGCEQPCLGCGCCGLYEPKDEPTTQTETQNSNLTFEKDECAKEYEELGLKELKELIEADRKTEPTISKMEQVDKDINVRSKDEPTTQTKTQNSNLTFEKADEPQTDCGTCKHHYGKDHYDIDCERLAFGSECRYEPQTDCPWK